VNSYPLGKPIPSCISLRRQQPGTLAVFGDVSFFFQSLKRENLVTMRLIAMLRSSMERTV
jgi:hypothetical protein